ncbi:Ankyrin Repeat [Seminavis robusta]|uniref:Ankyrin Repeat n=1 Tax=Seminavis robusta TaxID=568900 RepID=A0A9N8DHT9_9STRA|nr:Ankyrin Repeat [Seminavis robusta]|eukprot:Sro150_g068980.1 Ankyrin Repeat (479) ;mRNA; r:92911-94347
MNSSFRYLYRHDNDNDKSSNADLQLSPKEYLMEAGGYTEQQIQEMQRRFPPLLQLDVPRHLKPKMKFLKHTILQITPRSSSDDDKNHQVLPPFVQTTLPPQYYGARLERIVAPRHAFLVYANLYHGKELLLEEEDDEHASSSNRWQLFLTSCRNTKQFAALCNQWAKEKQQQQQHKTTTTTTAITSKQIEAFDFMFGRGLMAASRNELCQHNNTWPLDFINVTSAEMIDLLIQHGANPLERDNRGVSLLHWAAGTGNLENVQALMPHLGVWVQAERDGATPLHWAAAGANAREFGVGGHKDVAEYLLSQVDHACHHYSNQPTSEEGRPSRKDLVCQLTRDGNSALMWAAWSGTLETVKFLIRNRADPNVANRNGCTVAHWAASGGNLEVCQYLAETVGVDFTEPNHGGNTPLTHAVAFGHPQIVEWLRQQVLVDSEEDSIAKALAGDFVDWTEGKDENEKRQQVRNLFEDWYGHDERI